MKNIRSAMLLAVIFLLALLTGADSTPAQALPAAYPPDPTANIAWTAGTSGVLDVQIAFNYARA